MSGVLFVGFLVVAGAMVLSTVRWSMAPADRALAVAWQLAVLSMVPGLLTPGGQTVRVVVAVIAGAAGASATLVGLRWPGSAWRGALPPWLVVYAGVLVVGAGLSSDPGSSALRVLRALVLLVVLAQAAALLDDDVRRRLLARTMALLAGAVVLGAVVAPGQAFEPLRAPVLRWALTAPALGAGAHVVAAIGAGLLVATAWRWLSGDRPGPTAVAWSARVGVPAAVGIGLLAASQKRAFWLAAVVAVAAWLVLCRRRWLVPALAVLVVVVAPFLVVDSLRDLWDRERARPQIDNIGSVRGAIFEASVDRFTDRPLVGGGLGVGNRNLFIDVGQPDFAWASHSELGAVLAASGLAGLIVLVWGHGAGLRGVAKARSVSGDPMPAITLAASLALLPFWRILQEPLLVGVPYLTIVLPAHRWWRWDRSPDPAGRSDR